VLLIAVSKEVGYFSGTYQSHSISILVCISKNSTCKVKVTSLPPSNEPYISNTFSASTIPSEETGFSIPQRSNLPKNKNKSVPERKSLKLQKSGVACRYNLLPKSPSNHHNEAPTIPSTPKSLPPNSPQSPISQPTLQSSRSPPTSSHQVPKPQSFPNDHRSSTDTPQILHQCSLSNQKAIDLLSLSSTKKAKSPVAASPLSIDRSPLQHTNHTTPPASNESTPNVGNASPHLLHTKAHPNYIPATQLHPPSMKTLPSVGTVSLHPISMKAQQNFFRMPSKREPVG